MRLAIMQPYFFPYIGYFQLLQAADKMVFYDDVDYIKSGWINRNRIIQNGAISYFTVPLQQQSSNRKIIDTKVLADDRWRRKMGKTLRQVYGKAPFFKCVYPIVERVLHEEIKTIGEMAANSVLLMRDYLGIQCASTSASLDHAGSQPLRAGERVLAICEREGADQYINPAGGQALYRKEDFLRHGIQLHFLQTQPIRYRRTKEWTEEKLSILDLAMFNDRETITEWLNNYTLV